MDSARQGLIDAQVRMCKCTVFVLKRTGVHRRGHCSGALAERDGCALQPVLVKPSASRGRSHSCLTRPPSISSPPSKDELALLLMTIITCRYTLLAHVLLLILGAQSSCTLLLSAHRTSWLTHVTSCPLTWAAGRAWAAGGGGGGTVRQGGEGSARRREEGHGLRRW